MPTAWLPCPGKMKAVVMRWVRTLWNFRRATDRRRQRGGRVLGGEATAVKAAFASRRCRFNPRRP